MHSNSIVIANAIGRELTLAECRKPLAVMQLGKKEDLILRNSNVWGGKITNVPRRFNSSESVNWGYVGTGPYDLALNVLYHFSDQNEEFARSAAHAFVAEVISKLPMDCSICVKAEFLNAWVLEKMEANFEKYECGQLLPSHLAWDNDGKQILTPAFVD